MGRIPKKKLSRRGGRNKAEKRSKLPASRRSSTTTDEELDVVDDHADADAIKETAPVTTITAGSNEAVAVSLVAESSNQESSMNCSADGESKADGDASIESCDHPIEEITNTNQKSCKDIDEEKDEVTGEPPSTGARPRVIMDHEKEKQQSERLVQKAQETAPLTTTVYLAAPTSHRLAFVGECVRWNNPQGTFELVKKIDSDFGIFRGVIPVPSRTRSPFKFVLVENSGKIKYEGNSDYDNRYDELLPDTVYYFIFKPKTETIFWKIGNAWNETFGTSKTETRQKFIVEFLTLVFDRASEKVPSDWDAAFDLLSDGLNKLGRLQCYEFHDGLKKFSFDRLQLPEVHSNFGHLFLFVIGAHLTKSDFPDSLKDVLALNAAPFSRFLNKIPCVLECWRL